MKKYILLSVLFLVGNTDLCASEDGREKEDDRPCPPGYYVYTTPAGSMCIREGMPGSSQGDASDEQLGQSISNWGYAHPKAQVSQAEKERRQALRQKKLAARRAHGRQALNEFEGLGAQDGEAVAIVEVPGVRREHDRMPRSSAAVDLTRLTEDFGDLGLRVPGSGSSSSAVDITPERQRREGVDPDAMLASAAAFNSPRHGARGSLVRPGVLGVPQQMLLPRLDIAATQTQEARDEAATKNLATPRHLKSREHEVAREPLWRRSSGKKYKEYAGKKRLEREERHERKLEALRYERAEKEASRSQTPVERQAVHDGSWGAGGGVPVSTRSASSLGIRRPADEDYEEAAGAMAPRAGADESESDDEGGDIRPRRRRVEGAEGGAITLMQSMGGLRRNNGEDEE